MTRLISASVLIFLIVVGGASAQSPNETPENPTGTSDDLSHTNNTGAPRAGPGGQADQDAASRTTRGQKSPPPNKCDPKEAAKDGSVPNQNNASAGCVK